MMVCESAHLQPMAGFRLNVLFFFFLAVPSNGEFQHDSLRSVRVAFG